MKKASDIKILNKKAKFEYIILDRYTAGIQLFGTEIKSIREGKASLVDSYCAIQHNEMYVKQMHIAEYRFGSYANHEAKRDRNSPIASYDDASFAPHGQGLSTKGSKISPHDYIATNTRAVSEPVTKDEKHRRPIRAALSPSYPLNDVLWLESGLTYSMLYSSFTTSSGVTVSEDSQALGYLGIPLNLRASLWDQKMFDVYLSGG
ncbi:MAG: SsrA-binding protein, partial [Paludibacteraceae bacterium]|nr:SsrA-binding protein [Paludibacteraceae bacterium]